MLWSEVWYGESLRAATLRTLLTPASWLYVLGWNAYLAVYRLGLKKPKSPHSPVVCIGNLAVGGTGKTPATLQVASVLRRTRHHVVISCSGYGSPASAGAALAPEGQLEASRWGDEPAMIRWLLPHVPLIVGRDRVQAAKICHEAFPSSVMLMDDGFQHLPLHKDITIVLDPPSPNRRCMPAGPYREPRSHRKRATLVMPGTFETVAEPLKFFTPAGDQVRITKPANVLCALGRPESFLDGLKRGGVKLATVLLKPDHDHLMEGNLFELLPPEQPLLVTAKDWVKLRERDDTAGRKIFIAGHEASIEPAHEFETWLEARLDELKT